MEADQKSQTEREYTLQHFDFDPNYLSETFSEDALECLSFSLSTLFSIMEKKHKADTGEFRRAVPILLSKYEEAWNKKLDKLGIYLHSFFKIPKHILLPEDSPWDGLDTQTAKHRLDKCNKELQAKRERYQMLLYKKAVLRDTLQDMARVIAKQKEVLNNKTEATCAEFLSNYLEMFSQKKKVLDSKLEELTADSSSKTGVKKDLPGQEMLSSLKRKSGSQLEADMEAYKQRRRLGV